MTGIDLDASMHRGATNIISPGSLDKGSGATSLAEERQRTLNDLLALKRRRKPQEPQSSQPQSR